MKALQRAQLSKAQEQALDREIKKQVSKYNEEYEADYDTLILYTLHNSFGFGKERMKRFFREMNEHRKALKAFYNADGEDDKTIDLFVMRKKLSEAGISPEILLAEIYGEILL